MKTLLLAFLTFMLVACDGSAVPEAKTSDATRKLAIITAEGARHDFVVENALTPAQQRDGLMHRTEMAPNAGMLFVFPDEAPRSFWMKNTLIPLDMLFIARDGTVLQIHENAIPNDLTSIKSDGPAMAVLELNGGTASRLNIRPGDKIHSIFFGNSLAK